MDNQKLFKMKFKDVYPLLVNKAVHKNRTKEEVYQLTTWLTGYTGTQIDECTSSAEITYGEFFDKAPQFNPRAEFITGAVCGIRVEEVQDPLLKKIRYLDKIVDELAKGKDINSIMR